MLSDLSEVYGVLVLEDVAGARTAYDFVNPAEDANLTTITPLAAAYSDSSSAKLSCKFFLKAFIGSCK